MLTNTLSQDKDPVTPVCEGRPAIDTEALSRRCMGNIEFVLALLQELETSAVDQVGQLLACIARSDAKAAAEVAHSLKGGAAIVGAERLSRLAGEIEAFTKNEALERATGLTSELQEELARCLAQIPEIRIQASAVPGRE